MVAIILTKKAELANTSALDGHTVVDFVVLILKTTRIIMLRSTNAAGVCVTDSCRRNWLVIKKVNSESCLCQMTVSNSLN